MTCYDHRYRPWGQHRILCEACGDVRVIAADTAPRSRASGRRGKHAPLPTQQELPLEETVGGLEADVVRLMRERQINLDQAVQEVAEQELQPRNVPVDAPGDDTLGGGLDI